METQEHPDEERQPDPARDVNQEGDSSAKDRPPAAPAGDDPTPAGDTDQHSDA